MLGPISGKYRMKQYCIYTRDFSTIPQGFFQLLENFDIDYSTHINRTRYWIDHDNPNHLYVYLRYSDWSKDITHEVDHALGV